MGDFLKKAKGLVDKNEKKVDQALDKGAEKLDQRTGGKYGDKIDKGVDQVQRRTGQGDEVR